MNLVLKRLILWAYGYAFDDEEDCYRGMSGIHHVAKIVVVDENPGWFAFWRWLLKTRRIVRHAMRRYCCY